MMDPAITERIAALSGAVLDGRPAPELARLALAATAKLENIARAADLIDEFTRALKLCEDLGPDDAALRILTLDTAAMHISIALCEQTTPEDDGLPSPEEEGIWDMMGDDAWLLVLGDLVGKGKFDKHRPEDDLAHKLASGATTLPELSDPERDIYEDRLRPMLEAYYYGAHEGEAAFDLMREFGYFDQPDPDQPKLL